MTRHLTIGTKVLFAFVASILLSVGVGVLAWTASSHVSSALVQVSQVEFPSMEAIGDLYEAVFRAARVNNAFQVERLADPKARAQLQTDLQKASDLVQNAMDRYAALPHDPAVMEEFKQVRELWGESFKHTLVSAEAHRKRDELVASGVPLTDPRAVALSDEAWKQFIESRGPFVPFLKHLGEVKRRTEQATAAAEQEGQRAARKGMLLVTLAIAAGAIVSIGIALWVRRFVARSVHAVVAQADRLGDAVQEGRLEVRAEVTALPSEFEPMAHRLNRLMDAFAKPIRMASENMDRISRGDIPEQIRDAYQGDFEQIKDSVNRCIAAVARVVEDGKLLASAAVEGRLSTRADVSEHQGEFRSIVQGFNETLDAVTRPIAEATQVLEGLAQHDLRARVKGRYLGDHAKLTEALNVTVGALHDALAEVAHVVEQVTSASSQIASSSQAVASGASEQASSLEETGSSLESMTGMTRHAADHAQQANALAGAAKGAAAEGATAMGDMTAAMGRIKASAEGTSQIIKDINEIAFQTNLLALNAAVEAARAGEAGRGFAVVAEEVRSLALRSKEAANKTEALIRESVKEAVGGEVLAHAVQTKLAEIGTGAGKAYDVMSEIVASAKEQAAGIAQITKAVAQMNQVTQQNAASSEESSSAAAELAGQAQDLAAIVGAFRLERSVASTHAPALTVGARRPKALPGRVGSGSASAAMR